jgi:hypothetical protein
VGIRPPSRAHLRAADSAAAAAPRETPTRPPRGVGRGLGSCGESGGRFRYLPGRPSRPAGGRPWPPGGSLGSLCFPSGSCSAVFKPPWLVLGRPRPRLAA